MNAAGLLRTLRSTPGTDRAAGRRRLINGSCCLIASASVIAAGAVPATAAKLGPHRARAATPASACPRWLISGSWTVKQSDTTVPYRMVLHQHGTVISGTATFGSESGPISGSLVGSGLDVLVRFPNNPGGPIKGRYTATVKSGYMSGRTVQVGVPTNHARWSAKGPSHPHSCHA